MTRFNVTTEIVDGVQRHILWDGKTRIRVGKDHYLIWNMARELNAQDNVARVIRKFVIS